MNHDPPPSWPAQTPDTPASDRDAPDEAPETEGTAGSQSGSPPRRRKRSRKKRCPGLVKKLALVTHLLKTLDFVVFAELSALYYMECSMFRFLVRCVGQYMYLTPKDESFPFVMPASRVHVLLVVIPNALCMLLHLFGSLPTGPDFHRGYQHGGLIIDFVGQRPPAYRLYYLLADFVILAVQCLMLTVHTQREKLRVALKTFRPLLPEMAHDVAIARSPEDLDAEERGVARNAPGMALDDVEGIELRPLARSQEQGDNRSGRAEASSSLLGDASSEAVSGTHLSNTMSSGNAVLGEYHVMHSITSAAMDLERATAHSLQTISYGAVMAALHARRRGAAAQARSQPPGG